MDRYKGALCISVVADLIKLIHMHACLPKMILGCGSQSPAVDGSKQPRAKQSLLSDGAAG